MYIWTPDFFFWLGVIALVVGLLMALALPAHLIVLGGGGTSVLVGLLIRRLLL